MQRTGFRYTIHAHVARMRRLEPGPPRQGESSERACGVPFLISTHHLEWFRELTI